MPDPSTIHSDPLSDLTRKERRNLIITCVVGFMASEVGLVPHRVSIPGLEFSLSSPKAFLLLMEGILFYFLVAFITYGLPDFFAWRKRYQDYLEKVEKEQNNWSVEDQQAYDEIHTCLPDARWLYEQAPKLARGRLVFEFLFPIVAGLVQFCLLLRHIM